MDSQSATEKEEKKKAVAALRTWMSTHLHDVTPEAAKKYAKALHGAGAITIEKLVKKIKKEEGFLFSSKVSMDTDDARELMVALTREFNLKQPAAPAPPAASGEGEGVSAKSVATAEVGSVSRSHGIEPRMSAGGTVYLDAATVAAERKEKIDGMVEWLKANTHDLTLINMHNYANVLFDDNCATMTKAARRLERDDKYMFSLGLDPDDIREIVDAMKKIKIIKADFYPYDEMGIVAPLPEEEHVATDRAPAPPPPHPPGVADEQYVTVLEVFASLDDPLNWRDEIVGLLVSIYSEDTMCWLEGVVQRYDPHTACHDIHFPDDFVLDVNLNTHCHKIEKSEVTTTKFSAGDRPEPATSLMKRSLFTTLA
jgi:hypothetical protein